MVNSGRKKKLRSISQASTELWPFLTIITNFQQLPATFGIYMFFMVTSGKIFLKIEVNISIQYKVMDLDKLYKIPNFAIFAKIANFVKIFAVRYLGCNSLHFEVF